MEFTETIPQHLPQRGLQERFIDLAEQRKPELKGQLPRHRRIELAEALATTDMAQLVREVIVEQLRDSAEPVYVASRFFKRVRITEGRSIVFPSIGALRAHEIPEGGEYPREYLDAQLHEAEMEVKVQKVGLVVSVTDEMIQDAQWDVIGMLLERAGRAMARHKEEKVFREFERHGHTVFDGSYVKSDGTLESDAQPGGSKEGIAPTGRDIDGKYNGTLSVEDSIDLMIAMLANEKIPTDVLMNPLVWPIFVKNEYLGQLSLGFAGSPGNKVTITPDNVQGRLPFELTVTLTPFVQFDRVDKTFNLYVVDRNEVGVLLVKEDITTEQWDNPERDIQSIKVRERYGLGLFDDGKAVAVAKNIRFDKSYPEPTRVKMLE